MARVKGTRKINGIWYLPSQLDTNGIPLASSVNPDITQRVHDTTPSINSSLSVAPTTSQGHSSVSFHGHTQNDIRQIENQTGLVCVGFTAYGVEQVPVFLKADHSEDKRAELLAAVRRK